MIDQLDDLALRSGKGTVRVESSGPLGAVLARFAGLPRRGTHPATFQVEHRADDSVMFRREFGHGPRPRRCHTVVRTVLGGFVETRGPLRMAFDHIGVGCAHLRGVSLFGMPMPMARIAGLVRSARTHNGLTTEVTVALGSLAKLRYCADLEEVPQ